MHKIKVTDLNDKNKLDNTMRHFAYNAYFQVMKHKINTHSIDLTVFDEIHWAFKILYRPTEVYDNKTSIKSVIMYKLREFYKRHGC